MLVPVVIEYLPEIEELGSEIADKIADVAPRVSSETEEAISKAEDLPSKVGETENVGEKAVTKSNSSIKYQRQKAVSEAWKQEKNLVEKTGQGTRPWTEAEKEELITTGKVSGYQGHHINSVQENPELAGNPDNISFFDRLDHLNEHQGNWRNPTSGDLKFRILE